MGGGGNNLFNQFHIIPGWTSNMVVAIMNINKTSMNICIYFSCSYFFLVYSVAVPQNQSQQLAKKMSVYIIFYKYN